MFHTLTCRPIVYAAQQLNHKVTYQTSKRFSQFRTSMAPLPIVLCGKDARIATSVRDGLLPEFEVIHIILSVESGITDIPLLLSSQPPPNSSSNHGSQNYAKPPVAIALGGGWNDGMFEQLQTGCKDAPSTPWLRVDLSKVARFPTPEEMPMYGKMTAEKLKKRLGELKVGEEGGVGEGVFLF